MSEVVLSPDAGGESAEALGRRALGLDAAWWGAVGAGAVLLGGPVGVAVGLPAWLVRAAGAGAVGVGAATGLWSVAEDWRPGTRRAVAVNALASTALVGHAAARGTRGGRLAVLALAAQAAGFATAQARALVAAEPRPTATTSP